MISFFKELPRNEEKPRRCLFFDGKTDETLVKGVDENGRKFRGTHLEEHVTLVGQPGDVFYGHIAPIKKDAKTISDGIWEFAEDHDLDEELDIIGGDSCVVNMGHKSGIIRNIEEKKKHRCQIIVCKLHTN